ncbi:SRPBCC domain-containing protein [Parvularcula marina]|uniref:SRPBCC domain-containing protein n=1 Tax=Parvularcula marina TaxID=2292771 RepID=UPI003516E4FE
MSGNNEAEKAVYKVLINAPIDKVWSELVKTDEVLPFFFGAVCRTEQGLTVGQPMAMETPNGKYRSVVGKVLEFTPPHRYSHTLKFTNFGDAPCTIVYDLKEVEGGVEFTLTTLGAIPGSKTAKSMAQGGKFIVETFKSVVETGKPSFGTRMMLGMMGMMGPFTPKVCLTENWTFDNISKL